MDKVHILGMSENNSTYLTVAEFNGVAVEPPIEVAIEGEDAASVAISQGGLAARYTDEELRQIGEGNSIIGVKRVIGEIATSGNLEQGATKPLHPTLIDAEVVNVPELTVSTPGLTA